MSIAQKLRTITRAAGYTDDINQSKRPSSRCARTHWPPPERRHAVGFVTLARISRAFRHCGTCRPAVTVAQPPHGSA